MILAWAGGCQRIQITDITLFSFLEFGHFGLARAWRVEGRKGKGRKAWQAREVRPLGCGRDCGLWVLGGLWSTEIGTQVPPTFFPYCTALQQSRASHMLLSALLCCTCTSFPNRAVIRKIQPDNSHSPRLDLGPDQPPDPSSLSTATPRFTTQQPPKTTPHGRAGAQTGRRCSTPCSACSVHVWVGDCYGCRLADVNTQ